MAKVVSDKISIEEFIKQTGHTEEELYEYLNNKNRREDEALRDFKEKQIQKLASLRIQEDIAYEQLNQLKESLEQAQSDNNEIAYAELQAQVEEAEKVYNGAAIQSQKFSEQLISIGQESLVSQAEQEATQQKALNILKSRQDAVKQAELELQKAIEDNDEEAQKAAKANLDAAMKSAENVNVLNTKLNQSRIAQQEAAQSSVENNIKAIKNSGMPEIFKNAATAFSSKDHESVLGESIERSAKSGVIGTIAGAVKKIPVFGGAISKILTGGSEVLSKILDVSMAIRKDIDKLIDDTASVLSDYVGVINASIQGTGETFSSEFENVVASLGINRYIQQTAYLGQIANLTSKGIAFNVEQRALLETIRDKTVSTFDSLDANLLRLVRLKERDITASQFGLEAALRNTLNKVFKDSSYLQGMYDAISGAITDAVMVSGGKDIIEYSSVAQTWMGAMYESGIDSNTVNKFANAINYLGSGNVQGLASDAEMQRLILLSMDTINMDYADILQQGLTSSEITDLMTAIVNYLVEISNNTKKNNVLQSSYTQLFGMSMTDLRAFNNLQKHMNELTYVDKSKAMDVTQNEIERLQSVERTTVAEQVNNAIANAKFVAGYEIATDASKYLTWKTSNMILDILHPMIAAATESGDKKKAKTLGKLALIPEGTVAGLEGMTLWNLAHSLPDIFEINEKGGLLDFVSNKSKAPTYGEKSSIAGSLLSSTFKTVLSSIKSVASFTKASNEWKSMLTDWEKPEEDKNETLDELKKITSALVEANADASHKALATFLVGMTDDTLRSFASIFADEDAMKDTFEGKNNVLKDNMFEFAKDKTSNSKKSTSKSTKKSTKKSTSKSTTKK